MIGSNVLPRRYGGWLIAALAAALIAMVLVAAPADAKANKIDICHAEGNGGYHLISISANAEQAHRDNHGDGMVGDAVPGMEFLTFGKDCDNALAQAFSTDSDGNVRLLGELLDTNGDGVPSVGDTARTYEMPTDIDGIDYFDTSSWSDCVATDYIDADLDYGAYGSDNVSLSGSGYNCRFQWYQDDDYYHDNFYVQTPEGNASAKEYRDDVAGVYNNLDQVFGTDNTSSTSWNDSGYTSGDGPWLEVVFNFADPTP
jgi:hypothetical protein